MLGTGNPKHCEEACRGVYVCVWIMIHALISHDAPLGVRTPPSPALAFQQFFGRGVNTSRITLNKGPVGLPHDGARGQAIPAVAEAHWGEHWLSSPSSLPLHQQRVFSIAPSPTPCPA